MDKYNNNTCGQYNRKRVKYYIKDANIGIYVRKRRTFYFSGKKEVLIETPSGTKGFLHPFISKKCSQWAHLVWVGVECGKTPLTPATHMKVCGVAGGVLAFNMTL